LTQESFFALRPFEDAALLPAAAPLRTVDAMLGSLLLEG